MTKNDRAGHLASLKLDKKAQNSTVARYLSNPRLVILLLILIISLGVSSYLSLPRNLNPQINIPIVFVQTILPGGSPSDVEQLVTIPLEEPIRSLAKVKTVTSSSTDSVSAISIEFESGIDPNKAKSDVQSAVDSVTTLPKDTQRPNVQKLDFENQPVWTFDLTTDSDDGSLFKFAKDLQTKIKSLKEINKVDISGLEDTEVEITIKPEVFSAYGINPVQLSPIISSSLKTFPAGVVKTSKSSFSLNIDQQVVKVADIRNLRINLNGANVALLDIAIIAEHPKPNQNESFLLYPNKNIQRSVTFNVFKTSSINIDQAVKVSQNLVNGQIAKNPQFKISEIINTKELIDDQFNELAKDFTITIILVVLVLLVFLGARQALVSALSAPLSFLIAFSVMKLTGITLNFLSLFSLILSLGLLVDDTVVVMSAMTSYFRVGRFTPLQTGLLVWRDFLTPVFTTTITTVWAFLPLLLASGIIGEFIKSIPIVISTALIASFFVSIFVTLPLIIILLDGTYPKRVRTFSKILLLLGVTGLFYLILPKGSLLPLEIAAAIAFLFVANLVKGQLLTTVRWQFKKISQADNWGKALNNGVLHFDKINKSYQKAIEQTISSSSGRVRVIVMVIILFIFSFLLVPLGFVKNEFFPKTDQDTIYVSLELPAGTYIDTTKEQALSLLKQLQDTPKLRFVTADIGRTFQSGQGIGGSSTNNVLFTLNLTKRKQRNVPSYDIAQALREKFANYQTGTLNVQEQTGGPPAGADVQVKISGDNLGDLDSYANKVEDFLKTQSGVTNITKSTKSGTSKLTFVPDKSALTQNQIELDQLGLWLRLYATGFNIGKNKFEGDTNNKDITLHLSPNSASVDAIYAITIPTQSGNIPLSLLGKLVLEPNPTIITREDGKRTISATASITKGTSVAQINKKVGDFANNQLNLAEGYSWKTGGVNEQNQSSVNSILQAMVLSFLLIIITMVIQFNSFRRALIVMLVIPLSISGVFIIFALTHTALSFPALIGILALFGIVVKNSILVVDKIVKNQKEGLPLARAIGDASASRLEPIALTSFATILGLVPITLSDPLWRGLGGAIIAGLTFSGTIMLFFIPVIYYQIYKGEVN